MCEFYFGIKQQKGHNLLLDFVPFFNSLLDLEADFMRP